MDVIVELIPTKTAIKLRRLCSKAIEPLWFDRKISEWAFFISQLTFPYCYLGVNSAQDFGVSLVQAAIVFLVMRINLAYLIPLGNLLGYHTCMYIVAIHVAM